MINLALAQIHPRKGVYEENLNRIGSVFARVAADGLRPDLLIAPETVTSGYFVEGGVRDVAVPAGALFADLEERHRVAGAPPFDVALGFYEVWQNRFFNSALYARLGDADAGIVHVHRKVFLPTYGIFDEGRFVGRGYDVRAFDTRWGRAAVLICEDAWHSILPTLAALDGAQLIVIPSATPARGVRPAEHHGATRPGNVERWEQIGRQIAGEHGIYVALAQLVGFEGGKAFCGGSAVFNPRGHVVARGPLFEEALLSVAVDPAEITRTRAAQPLLADLEAAWPHLVTPTPQRMRPPVGYDRSGATSVAVRTEGKRVPAVDATVCPVDPLAIDPKLLRTWLVAFLRDELTRRRGFTKGIVGLSGGVDSSLTAFLAVEALGKDNVIGVRMPYSTSSSEALDHAELVANTLEIECLTVDISAAVDGYIGQSDADASAARRGNVMARQRMIVLFDLSAKFGALPLGTGNKSERLLGYYTWHADDSPPVNPLGDLYKSQVWELAKHVGVPEVIVSKPATADLIRGQTDEGDLGVSYPTADHVLFWLLHGLTASEIEQRGFDLQAVEIVQRRLASTHWKRRLPTVAIISHTAIGEFYLRPVDY